MIYEDILQTIGGTPLVKINRLNPNKKVTIYAKIEGVNPSGSIKDRIALKMIEQAEAKGKLSDGKIIIEATSGNTGIGLAMVGAVKGYQVVVCHVKKLRFSTNLLVIELNNSKLILIVRSLIVVKL